MPSSEPLVRVANPGFTKRSRLAWLSRNEKVEAPLYAIENIQHDNLILDLS
jgi:hypothetical protein